MMLSKEKIALKSNVFYHFFEPVEKQMCKISYAVVKGEPLSFYAYKEFGRRYFNDLDLLISKRDMKSVRTFLEKNNFVPMSQDRFAQLLSLGLSHQIIPYVKYIGKFPIYIDINFDLFWGEYEGKRIDIDEFLCDAIEMEIHGVKVKTLTPIKAMIQLILHHYKDMNSIFLLATQKSIRYEMFKDLYYLLKNNVDIIPLDKLYMMSVRYEIVPYVFYLLYYTGQIYNDDILEHYIEAFRTSEGESLLDYYGLCDKERKKWKYDFRTRLEAKCLYDLIKHDLTEDDQKKIEINKKVFLEALFL